MRIEKKKISDLLPADYNPRKDLQPGDKEYDKLLKSIQEFDYVDPVIWNKRTGTVVGGHQRLKVLKDLGHTSVEVSVVDIPVEKEMALNVALNKVSGDWDMFKLSDLFVEMQDMDIDMELTGFDLEDINELNDFFGGSNPDEKYKTDKEAPIEKIPEKKILDMGIWDLLKSKKKIYVQFSGGKDSMAQVATMIDHGIDPDKMIIIHNSTPNDYPDLKKFVINFSKKIKAKDCIIIGNYTEKETIEIFERNGFPLQHMVWCTSSWKIQPMQKYFKELSEKENKDEIVICQGWRKEESERRDSANDIIYDKNGFLLCRPIMDMKIDEVFNIIKKHGWNLHPSYKYRQRLSCLYCFAIPRNEWDAMRTDDPENFFRALKLVCYGAGSHNIKGDTFKNTIRKMMGMDTMAKRGSK